MITAMWGDTKIEASYTLDYSDQYTCPDLECGKPVMLKKGRLKIPHFAHWPGVDCMFGGEGLDHVIAKKVLASQFRALGYTVELERVHEGKRRVDVAVNVGRAWVAVEAQESPISIDEMKERMALDREFGYAATLWVFIGDRFMKLIKAAIYGEGRIPEEISWLYHRFKVGLFALQLDYSDYALGVIRPLPPIKVDLDHAWRDGRSWEDAEGGGSSRGGHLKSTFEAEIETVGFKLSAVETCYSTDERREWTAVLV